MTLSSKFLLAAAIGSTASCFAASIPKTILPDNVVRCEPGAGCVNQTLYGRNYKVIATPRFTVMVSISREGIYTRADVSVSNNTDTPLSVSPDDFRVEVVTPKPKVLLYVPPAELNLPTVQPVAAASTTQGASPQAPASPVVASNVEASLPATPEDAEAQKAAQREVAERAAAQQPLAATSIPPSEVARGRVYFASDKKAQLVNVVLPIAGVVFEFPYALKR
jgi:hypothetical protein